MPHVLLATPSFSLLITLLISSTLHLSFDSFIFTFLLIGFVRVHVLSPSSFKGDLRGIWFRNHKLNQYMYGYKQCCSCTSQNLIQHTEPNTSTNTLKLYDNRSELIAQQTSDLYNAIRHTQTKIKAIKHDINFSIRKKTAQ